MTKLICFDMDGVIFKDINFWLELHKAFGTLEQGEKLTKKYLHTDYNRLVQEVVVKLWKGKDAKVYFNLVKSLKYLPGVKEVFTKIKQEDWLTALISASSIEVARRAQHDLGIDFIYANELVIKGGKVSGEFIWPIGAGKEKKAQIIHHLCKDMKISPEEVIYVGDSETDLDAFKIVGTSIAFNSQSETLKKASSHVVEGNDLRGVLKFLK